MLHTMSKLEYLRMEMIMNPGRSGINWEMNTLYQNSASFEKTIFHYGGETYQGSEVFQIAK